MNRVLLAIGGLLVGLLATMFAAPAMVDWNRYRGMFEEEATRFLGREVRVGGRVNLRLLPVPYVQFEQVRVADMSASVGRPLFMADSFTVWLSVGALLAGALEASDIELKRPTVTLVLDGKGGGNWASLSPDNFRGSFVPARVAFDAVRITDGSLAILNAAGAPKTSFQNINGELSAQALDGPYRVAAEIGVGGSTREFRLSTAKPAADGSVRFKSTVRDPQSGVSYSLEGDARDVLSSIKIAGELTARLPLPASLAAQAPGKPAAAGKTTKVANEFDLRAKLNGDTKGFTLADLALSFEQEGRPQMATGEARVNFTEPTDVSVKLKSHWLDLDKIAGAGTGGSPLELAQGVAAAVSSILATEGRTEASLTIDQATLGGDVVSSLIATLEHREGRLIIRNLTAGLPGGARLATAGAFEGTMPDNRYAGRVDLRGASMARFAGWLAPDRKLALPARDGAFTVAGDLSLGSREVAGRNLTVEVGRNMLTGDASWKAGKPQQIMLNLEGSELDLTPFVAEGVEPADGLRELVTGLAGVKGRAASPVQAADADIRLRLDRLVVGAAVFRDAWVEAKLAGGQLSMPQLRLVSPEGYVVELKGDIADFSRSTAKGTLTGLVSADGARGLAALTRLAGLPPGLGADGVDAAFLVPLRVAGRLEIGSRGPDSHELTFDGLLARSRLAGTLRLGIGPAGWRERPTDLAMTLEGVAARRLLGRAAGAPAEKTTAGAAAADTRLTLRGIGSPKAGMTILAAIEGDGVKGAYRGRASVDDQMALGLDGEIEIALSDLARGLALAGLEPRAGLEGPVKGLAKIERSGRRTTVSVPELSLAGVEATGRLVIDGRADSSRVAGDIKLSRGSLTGLLALLTTPGVASPARGERPSPWSEAPLDLAPVDKLAGSRIEIQIGRLAMAPGLDISDARVTIAPRAGGLDLRVTEGTVHGGQATGSLAMSKAPAGVRLVAEAAISGMRLEKVAPNPGGTPKATGGLSLDLKLESTALSPRGLVVALAGGGELRLSQAKLNRWAPAAIAGAVEAVLAVKGEIPPGALRAQLELALNSQGVSVGSSRLPVSVADGALRAQPLVVTVQQGRLTGRGAIDLDHLLVDGEWRIEPRNSPRQAGTVAKPELPAVTVSYTGPLAELPALEPKLDTEALEREVAVRKVEREVLELERLRKLDEDRAKDEARRQQTERTEAERLRTESLQHQPGGPLVATPSQPGGMPASPGSTTEPDASSAAASAPAADVTPLTEEQKAATPPVTVERAPLPRPASTTPKSKGRSPFNPLQESSP